MKRNVTSLAAAVTIALTANGADPGRKDCPPPPPGFPKFQWQEIAADFKIGYAVHLADVNGDEKPDIVVVDKDRVVWYENPTWKVRTILKGKTKPDNVCICSLDIDGDKKIDFVLGAGWRGTDTKTPGTLQWLRQGKTLDDEWEMFPIPCEEPTVHRVGMATLKLDSPAKLVVVPLMGREATKEKNWMDGHPVRILAYDIPKNASNPESWKPSVLNEQLHVTHNFSLHEFLRTTTIYCVSYEGVSILNNSQHPNSNYLLHEGNQSYKQSSRGGSEIAVTKNNDLAFRIATIEPWHGNQVVIYPNLLLDGEKKLKRIVIDDHLRWGHAIKSLELDDSRSEMIIAGVRDNPDPKQGDTFTEKRGVRLYRATDAKGEKWERYILEDGGVAVEDLAVADLNNDGKPDIVAVGRATQNCRIYWNMGK